jgi:hypothetical protein
MLRYRYDRLQAALAASGLEQPLLRALVEAVQLPKRKRRPTQTEMKTNAAVKIQGLALIIKAKQEATRRRAAKAATRIQALYRGFCVYRCVQSALSELRRRLAIVAVHPYYHGSSLRYVPQRFRLHVAALRIQCMVRIRNAKKAFEAAEQAHAALAIQRSYRKLELRKRMISFKRALQLEARKTRAATKIAAVARGWLARRWYTKRGGKQELEERQRLLFPLRNRDHRVDKLRNEEDRLASRIDRSRRTHHEQEILNMIYACANPNADIVEWSTNRLRKPVLTRRTNAPVKLPPLETIPAQGNSGSDGAHSSFVPQYQALEPGLQSLLVTEPTNLLASTTTLKHVTGRAAAIATRRLAHKYKGLPDETESMRYALTAATHTIAEAEVAIHQRRAQAQKKHTPSRRRR